MMECKLYKPKKDKYTKARGGSSAMLLISCAQCQADVLLYQKDGPGPLLRMYLDKIHAPETLVNTVTTYVEKSKMPALHCSSCRSLIGVPMIYERENRLA